MARARPYDRKMALEAATQLFWEKGFVGTSWKDLEYALSMKPGSIHAAFKSKEALFLLSLEHYFGQSRAILESLRDGADPVLDGLGSLLKRIGKNAEDDPLCKPCMVIKTLLETSSVSDEIAVQAREYLAGMVDEIRMTLDAAKERGELDRDVDTAALAQRVQANVTALRLEAHMSENPDALQRLANGMAEDLLRCAVN